MVASTFEKVRKTHEKQREKRIRCVEKERRRNNELNEAFYNLQCKIPELQMTQRLPRIKTLRLAIQYISWLNQQLRGQPTLEFSQIAMQEMQVKNSYSARIYQEEQPLPEKKEAHESFHCATPLPPDQLSPNRIHPIYPMYLPANWTFSNSPSDFSLTFVDSV